MQGLVKVLTAASIAVAMGAMPARALEDDQLDIGYIKSFKMKSGKNMFSDAAGGVLGRQSNGAVLGVDSVQNFSSYFYRFGASCDGCIQYTWPYTMVGRSPMDRDDDDDRGRTTHIRAPIVPVTIDLRNFDGSPRFLNGKRLILSPSPYVARTLASPIFSMTNYSSSAIPTQFNDAIQRAQFHNVAGRQWHTILDPVVKPERTMSLIRGTYRFALNPDGTLAWVLVNSSVFGQKFFPPGPGDTTTVIGQAETAGDITTKDISTFLFANTFLGDLNGGDCCILGYHTYDIEPGDQSNGFRERRYVLNFSSWFTPGVSSPGVEDVFALSHEMAETFNDPFLGNVTPVWTGPNGLCANVLETGDVIEGLPEAIKTIPLNGFNFHVQTEALLQWFAGEAPSSAIGGAYSYPDPVLTTPSVSEDFSCQALPAAAKRGAVGALGVR